MRGPNINTPPSTSRIDLVQSAHRVKSLQSYARRLLRCMSPELRYLPTGGELAHPQNGICRRIRRSLDGRQRRDASCGSVADQRGKHEINGCRQFDPGPVGRWRAAAGTSVRHVLNECSTAPWRPLTNISSRSEGFRYLRTGYLPGKPLSG